MVSSFGQVLLSSLFYFFSFLNFFFRNLRKHFFIFSSEGFYSWYASVALWSVCCFSGFPELCAEEGPGAPISVSDGQVDLQLECDRTS